MQGKSPLDMMERPARPVRGPPSPRRRGPWLIVTPILSVLVLAGLWTWLWYYAASVADRTLAAWIERETAVGRTYSCGSQSIGGFPLRIEVRCTDVAAEISDHQAPFALRTKAASFVAEVWHPTQLTGNVDGPLAFEESGRPPSLAADWEQARITVRGIPPQPESLSLALDAAHVDRIGVGTLFRTKRAELQSRIIAGTARDHPLVELTLYLTGASAPPLHPLLAQPIDAEIDVVVRGLKNLSPKPWRDLFRDMQAAPDGGMEVRSLRIAASKIIVVGNGTLTVNSQGKLGGLVRVAIVGVENLVPLLGIDRLIGQGIDRLAGSEGAASAIDRLVPGLSGALRESASASLVENLKKMGEPSSIDKKPAVVLPLRLVDGAVYLGMLRIGEVPPVF